DQTMHVLRVVEYDGDVAALPGKAGAAAAGEYRCTVLAANRHRRDRFVRIAWNQNANRHLAVVRSVGRIQRPTASIESDFAAYDAPKIGSEIVHRILSRAALGESSPACRGRRCVRHLPARVWRGSPSTCSPDQRNAAERRA